MVTKRSAPAVRRVEDVLPGLGMRRIRWVRVRIVRDQVRAEVVGTGYRNPVVRSVPLSWANRLIRAGWPFILSTEVSKPSNPSEPSDAGTDEKLSA